MSLYGSRRKQQYITAKYMKCVVDGGQALTRYIGSMPRV